MVQPKDVTHNITLCENNSLVSAEETQKRKPAVPCTHIDTYIYARTRAFPLHRHHTEI